MISSLLVVNSLILVFCVFFLFRLKTREITDLISKLVELNEQLKHINKIEVENTKFIKALDLQKEVLDNLNKQIKNLNHQIEDSLDEGLQKQKELARKAENLHREFSNTLCNVNTELKNIGNQVENSWKESLGKQDKQIEKAETIYENLSSILGDKITPLISGLENLSNQIDNSLKESSVSWDDAIDNSKDEGTKLMLLEAASLRFPKNKRYIKEIRKILEPKIAGNEDLLTRREAIVHLENLANRFFNLCNNEDFQYANSFKKSVQFDNRFLLNEIDKIHKANIEKQLNSMKEAIDQLAKDSTNNSILSEIEKIDENINQKILNRYPQLKKEYKKISDELVQVLDRTNSRTHFTKTFRGNNKAIENAKEILQYISNNKTIIGGTRSSGYDGDNLQKLVRLLTNIDQNILLPTTQQYLRLAESTLFDELNSTQKETFTRLMVQETYKA